MLHADPLLALLVILTSGLLLGRVKVKGLSLGTSGTLFTALAAGHFGLRVPEGIGALGLLFFVYCLGVGAGPSFFRAFARKGKVLVVLAAGIVLSGALTAALVAQVLGLSPGLTAGLFAGAMTSTPGLAAASEVLPGNHEIAVGYGLAYPFGVVAVVLFVQLLPRLLGVDLSTLEDPDDGQEDQTIHNVQVEIRNPAVFGMRLEELELQRSNIQVSRVLEGRRMVPVHSGLVLEEGQVLLLVGRAFRLERVVPTLGKVHVHEGYQKNVDGYRRGVVVTSRDVVGRSLRELKLLGRFGVTVSRIRRHEIEFVPHLDDIVRFGDSLQVVGEKEALKTFAEHAGHRAKVFDVTNQVSLGLGLILGVVLGKVRFSLAGGSFKLGTAGGPLVVALILGHFGTLGPISGSYPRASRLLLQELGLGFFLAAAGTGAGGSLVAVIRAQGLNLCLGAATMAFAPLVLGYLAARYLLGMELLETLGATCGAMTSTPGLGAVSAETDSDLPVISYAAVYPVALILMTVCTGALIHALGG